MASIIQWNCRGLLNNHNELSLLSQQYNPVAMCLQETHIVDESRVSFKGYTLYNKLEPRGDVGVEYVLSTPLRVVRGD